MLLSGPTFMPTQQISVSFDGTSVDCVIVDINLAFCISPRLSKAGQVSVKLYIDTIEYDKATTFYTSKFCIILSSRRYFVALSR